MTKELSAAEKAFIRAKADFLTLSKRTTKALNREKELLAKRVKRANVNAKKLGIQINARREQLEKTASEAMKKTLREQMANLKKTLAQLREDTTAERAELAEVRKDLASARDHLVRALHVDKAITKLETQWKKATQGKPKKTTKKRAGAKRKAAAGKKKVTGKKAASKKRTSAKAPSKPDLPPLAMP